MKTDVNLQIMRNQLIKKLMKKKIFKKVLILSLPLGLTPFLAQAGLIDYITSAAIGGVIWVLVYILGAIAGAVLTLGGMLVDFALRINLALLNNPFIKIGWSIVLGFTNLGFVLAIIVIAFATILRFQSYGIKKALWKLIVAALLVNFSLAIAGFFIEISDSVTVFFNNKIQGTSGGAISAKLADILMPQFMLSGADLKKLQQQNATSSPAVSSSQAQTASSSQTTNFGSFGATAGIGEAGDVGTLEDVYNDPPSFNSLGTMIKGIATLLFIAIFTILSALTLLGVAITLIVRYIYLTFLLILSPIIWLAWIFPPTAQWWKWWWKKLLYWLIFAPVVMFFLYLTIFVIIKYPNAFSEYADGLQKNQSFALDVSYISSLIMIIGLLMGGLILSGKLGTVGSKAAFGAAEGLTKGVGAWGKKLPLGAGAWALRKTGLSTAASDLGTRLSGGGRVSQWFGKRVTNFGIATGKIAAQRPPSLYASMVSGMKKGSGLFKGKSISQWACDVCGNTVTSTKKPIMHCSNYGKPMPPNAPGAIPPAPGAPPGAPWTHGPNGWDPVVKS